MKSLLRLKWPLFFLVIITVFMAAGCTSAPAQPAAPSIRITQPTDGGTVSAGAMEVNVEVTGFDLVDKLGDANVPGQGHIHYFLDMPAPTTPGKPAIPDSGTWAATASTMYSFEDVSVGTHTVSAELVNNDHTPLNPPVVSKVTLTATPGGLPAD